MKRAHGFHGSCNARVRGKHRRTQLRDLISNVPAASHHCLQGVQAQVLVHCELSRLWPFERATCKFGPQRLQDRHRIRKRSRLPTDTPSRSLNISPLGTHIAHGKRLQRRQRMPHPHTAARGTTVKHGGKRLRDPKHQLRFHQPFWRAVPQLNVKEGLIGEPRWQRRKERVHAVHVRHDFDLVQGQILQHLEKEQVANVADSRSESTEPSSLYLLHAIELVQRTVLCAWAEQGDAMHSSVRVCPSGSRHSSDSSKLNT